MKQSLDENKDSTWKIKNILRLFWNKAATIFSLKWMA